MNGVTYLPSTSATQVGYFPAFVQILPVSPPSLPSVPTSLPGHIACILYTVSLSVPGCMILKSQYLLSGSQNDVEP